MESAISPSTDDRSRRRRCVVIGTGGTIGTVGADSVDRDEYMYGGSSAGADSLLVGVAHLPGMPVVESVPFLDKASHDIDSSDQLALARLALTHLSRAEVDGVVIQHGTNTLEETAFLLDLLLPVGKPTVVVGSMRPQGVVGSDAEANLTEAVRVAVSPQAVGNGVLVCLSGSIFAACDVAKVDSRMLPGFGALRWGPVGVVESNGTVVVARSSPPGPGLIDRLASLTRLPRVDLLLTHTDASPDLIDAAVSLGGRGIVVAGSGAGFPTSAQLAAMRRAAQAGVLVCRASRINSAHTAPPGRTVADPDPQFVWSGRLAAVQARQVVAVALALAPTPADAAAQARALIAHF